jgi:hypothetical protein
MKDFKGILGCALISCGLIGMIVCAIAACVFAWQNPYMTEMRRFLEYPWPTVWIIVDCVGIHVGCWLIES